MNRKPLEKIRITVTILIAHTDAFDRTKVNVAESLRSLSVAQRKAPHVLLRVRLCVNAFPDDSAKRRLYTAFIRKSSRLDVRITYRTDNLGFAGGHNFCIDQALAADDPDWVMILNDDAAVAENFFHIASPYLFTRGNSVISGTALNTDQTIQSIGLRYFPSGIALLQTAVHPVPHPYSQRFCGVFALLSRRTILSQYRAAGYVFNPLYHLYAEDLEFSLRLNKSGTPILLVDGLRVVHKGSQSAGNLSDLQLFYSLRNWLYTIILLWSGTDLRRHGRMIFLGQLKLFVWTLKLRRYRLYPSILLRVLAQFPALLRQRRVYRRTLRSYDRTIAFDADVPYPRGTF